VGLENTIERRIGASRMGFGAKVRGRLDMKVGEVLRNAEPDDLIQFGLIPELVGRLPVVLGFDELDDDALLRILTEPKNALVKQYIKLFRMDSIDLTFADGVLEYIVDKAIEFKLGARGLRSICEAIMLDAMFEMPSVDTNELEITIDYASRKLERINLKVLKAS
jgi:ATP-dependent Clp protease ATP-binding subunit ClpX